MDDAAETAKPPNGEELQKEGAKWIERIRAAEKREAEWRKDAAGAEKAFASDSKAKDGTLYDFNILHSNVETIVPAIYNSTPIPDVRRRFVEALEQPKPPQPQQGPDGQPVQPPPQVIQQFQMAMQQYQATAQRDKDAKDFGDIIERAIIVQIDDNKLDKEIERGAQDAFLAGRDIVRVRFDVDDDGEVVSNERIEFEAVSWRDFRMGPATRWENVPWVAFRHVVSREAAEGYTDKAIFDAQVAQMPATSAEGDEKDDIAFWEIWCKTTKKVKFIQEHDSRVMKIEDDPLGLRGFFPVPEPVQPITITAKMTPVCPFTVYQKLADELDTITKRINKIMKGLKVRGLVIGSASKVIDLQTAGDNELVVDSDLEGLAQIGIEKAVLWWPVEQGIKVLKELYAQREVVKSSIYEITGISDIIRGTSNANETLGAQEIKTQWGALRIQKMQRMVERQVRDIFGIMAEIIASKFSPETLYKMTGIQVTEGVRMLMQEPILTGYRVDVESDSTVRADLTRAKKDMAEFMTGTGNYFKTMAPLVQTQPQLAEPITEIYSSFARVFKLGKQAEDALDKMGQIAKQAASNPQPNPEAEAAKAEAQAKAQDRQAEMQMKQAEFQMKDQAEQRKAALSAQQEQRKLAFEQQKAGIDLQVAQTNLQIKQVELAIKKEEASLSLQTKAAESQIRLDGQRQANAMKAEAAHEAAEAKREGADA